MQLINGDCLEAMAALPDSSVDAIVTDPPYGLSFMGKAWDYDVPQVEVWREAFRVLKPGGHLLAFFGSRTYHRGAVQIEDAGFEIRDQIMWIYGSGFPKSLDVSKAVDKIDAAEKQVQRRLRFTAWMRSTGLTARQVGDVLRASGLISKNGTMAGHYFATCLAGQPAIMTREHLEAVRHLITEVPEWVEHECNIRTVESENFKKREVIDTKRQRMTEASTWATQCNAGRFKVGEKEWDITAPATDAAKQWDGWGTALKPAHEPVVMARKPLIGTVAANVMEHGTGAINVDGTRIGERWPANVIHDGSDEATRLFGDAARFFYCAKANKADRGEGNTHPTVKPTELMRYLCRLVTPPGGVVLDPFMGSGSTGKAALLEGFDFIGIERDPDYCAIAQQRIAGIQPQLQLVAGNSRDPKLADLGEVA